VCVIVTNSVQVVVTVWVVFDQDVTVHVSVWWMYDVSFLHVVSFPPPRALSAYSRAADEVGTSDDEALSR
jgi:hypothetical protein